MKISTHYNRIDRVVYEFDESDIQRALMTEAKLRYQSGKHIVFEINQDEDYKTTATLTVVWETPEGEKA